MEIFGGASGADTRKPNAEKRKQIGSPEIEDLREPFRVILKKLRGEIDSGEFSVIIGDDASGRVPALVMYRFLKAIYEEAGRPKPSAFFIAGTNSSFFGLKERRDKAAKVAEFFEHVGVTRSNSPERVSEEGRAVVVVTDTVATGKSLESVCGALRERGAPFVIASIGMVGSGNGLEEELGGKIVGGAFGTPRIYGAQDLGGVEKNPGEVFSHRYFKKKGEGRDVLEARNEDINVLVGELKEWYKANR